jgi:hypothetical protein
MTEKRHRPGQFQPGQSGNPKGKPPGSGCRQRIRSELLDAIGGTDKLRDIAQKMRDQALAGDVQSARLLLERLVPPLRSVDAPVSLPALEAAKGLTEAGQEVLRAIARGEVTPDTGASLLQALGAHARIRDIDELERRIAALEGGS